MDPVKPVERVKKVRPVEPGKMTAEAVVRRANDIIGNPATPKSEVVAFKSVLGQYLRQCKASTAEEDDACQEANRLEALLRRAIYGGEPMEHLLDVEKQAT